MAMKGDTTAMSHWKVLGLFVVAGTLVAVWLGTRHGAMEEHTDSTPKTPATVVEQPASGGIEDLIWRLEPDSTRIHTILPVTAGRKWPQNPEGESLSLALVEQTYTTSILSPIGASEISSSAFWVVEIAENKSITAGRILGVIHPVYEPYFGDNRDAQLVYYPQIGKFLVVVSESSVNTYIQVFEVESNSIHGSLAMILPECSEDWPPQMSDLALAWLHNKIGPASQSSVDVAPSIIAGTERYPFGTLDFDTAYDFIAYSPRHQTLVPFDITYVGPPLKSDRRSAPPIDPTTTWQPVANSEKVIAASPHFLPRSLAIVEQEFLRSSDSANDSKVRTKAYWVLHRPPDGTFDNAVPFYFLPPDESRRIELAQILSIGLPHQLPYFLAAAEIDGKDLVIRYYSITKSPEGGRPFEFDTLPKDWPTQIEPTSELRIKSPIKKLGSFFAYASSGNLIFGVADESSQAYFKHSPKTDEWTRFEIRNRLQIKE